jgi:GxxExxY protein
MFCLDPVICVHLRNLRFRVILSGVRHMDADVNRRDHQTHAILGALIEVHRQPGSGFVEAVYQEAAALEFGDQHIPSEREVPLVVRCEGTPLECYFRADVICYGEVLVELKAVERLTNVHQAQVINYLKATGLKRALLVNFGAARLEYRRIVLGYEG